MLEEIGEKNTRVGEVTLGILIGQDLAVVPMMLIISSLEGGEDGGLGWGAAFKVVASIAFLGLLITYLSRREKLRLDFLRAGERFNVVPDRAHIRLSAHLDMEAELVVDLPLDALKAASETQTRQKPAHPSHHPVIPLDGAQLNTRFSIAVPRSADSSPRDSVRIPRRRVPRAGQPCRRQKPGTFL